MENPEQINSQVQNSLDSSGSAQPTPQGQPQAAPVAAAQAPVAAPAASAGMPPVAATSKNPQLHRLISGILGGIAGPPPATYSADPQTGKLTANAALPENNADRVKRIAQHALIGLSAG